MMVTGASASTETRLSQWHLRSGQVRPVPRFGLSVGAADAGAARVNVPLQHENATGRLEVADKISPDTAARNRAIVQQHGEGPVRLISSR